mmetsp:Transcript_9453/g.17530  ORF Transcript_9453/g.17530 Transcript_9453/m.17530 type:complete len:104 (+) Transcript_9453:73-384(+)
MGCSASTAADIDEFGGKKGLSRVEPVSSVNFKDGKEVSCEYKESLQSFESMACCNDGGDDHPGRPNKVTHKRHMAQLNEFLKNVNMDPGHLDRDVTLRRIVEM